MIDLALRVVFDGEKVDVAGIKASDLVALERHFQVALPRLSALTFEMACFIVWRVLTRQGTVTGPFDDVFLDRIEHLEEIEDPPFGGSGPAPSPGSSP